MGRRRKLVLGCTPIGGKAIKSRKVARIVTSKYHKMRHELLTLPSADMPEAAKRKRKSELEQEIKELGGIDAYQQASVISTQYFKTSKWILKVIGQLIPSPDHKLRTLEVGAINTQLLDNQKLDVRAIDINSQNPRIEEFDFFNIEPAYDYEVVVCSMVVNFVTVAARRGEMIARLMAQLVPTTGLLFLVLPLRCVESPLVGRDKFEALLSGLGAELAIEPRVTPKLIFYVIRSRLVQIRSSTHTETIIPKWAKPIQLQVQRSMPESIKAYFSSTGQQAASAEEPKNLSVFSVVLPEYIL